MQFVPHFPPRSLRSCQVIHHTHRHTIDSRRERNASIAAQPVSEVLQRLEDVVANLLRVIVGNKSRRVSIRHKQRPRIQRIVPIQAAHIWTMDEIQHLALVFRQEKRCDKRVQGRAVSLLCPLPRLHQRQPKANKVRMRYPESREITLHLRDDILDETLDGYLK